MANIVLSLGSNIEPEANLQAAVKTLRERFGPLTLSPVYRSPAVGMQADEFLNSVVIGETRMSPLEVVDQLQNIEEKQGRDRSLPKFSSRTLDVDLLLYDDEIISQEAIEIPRVDILEHAFVLQPLADIAGEWRHPVLDVTYSELLVNMRTASAESFRDMRVETMIFPDFQELAQ